MSKREPPRSDYTSFFSKRLQRPSGESEIEDMNIYCKGRLDLTMSVNHLKKMM